ncbi:hypothetical protein UCRNP2_7822 [Neofusicoccum parvum UCRNP2]|uniref:Integral membrane protein n=1 Tax=Botryosphaeria parva (strain UCR-NP2) TaxID=1287680 RepID=R1EDC9_BOTPV|nr:hypothetical protein UCRNP2_7822 [Neofusicoccum parvum UCRNP2]
MSLSLEILRLLALPATMLALWQVRTVEPVTLLTGPASLAATLDRVFVAVLFLGTLAAAVNMPHLDPPPGSATRQSVSFGLVLAAGIAFALGLHSKALAWTVLMLGWTEAAAVMPAELFCNLAAWVFRAVAVGCVTAFLLPGRQ